MNPKLRELVPAARRRDHSTCRNQTFAVSPNPVCLQSIIYDFCATTPTRESLLFARALNNRMWSTSTLQAMQEESRQKTLGAGVTVIKTL